MGLNHESIEKNIGFMLVLIVVVISIGGLVQIVPLFFQHSTTEPVDGLEPYNALALEGRDVYVREGCYVCPFADDSPVPRGNRTIRSLLTCGRICLRPSVSMGFEADRAGSASCRRPLQ